LADAYREPVRHEADLAAVARRRVRLGKGDSAYARLLEHRDRLDDRGLRLLARMARRRARKRRAVTEPEDEQGGKALYRGPAHAAPYPTSRLRIGDPTALSDDWPWR
jgi:hypothetical protein